MTVAMVGVQAAGDLLDSFRRGMFPGVSTPLVVVDLESPGDLGRLAVPVGYPAVMIGVGADGGSIPRVPLLDFSLTEGRDSASSWVITDDLSGELACLEERIATCPIASVHLAQLLRSGPAATVESGLLYESVTYSTLQGGPELARWLRARRLSTPASASEDPVLVSRTGEDLTVVLNRPQRHNAYDARTRDRLCDALAMALVDDSVQQVYLSGNGPSFCSGGDLDEFGTFADPSSAQLIRVGQSPARLIHLLSTRMTVKLHGWCVGSGIELAAFAGRVTADPEAKFLLPEIGMGLIPGAGGTVSLPARIGRHRTAWMALAGRPISTATALRWGLVDAVMPVV